MNLQQKWESLKKTNPNLRIRNAAEKLGVSEVELLATKIGNTVTRLNNEPKAILKDLKPLQKVMALTRNEYCVHERKGIYKNHKIDNESSMGVFVTKDIDLRIFFDKWASVFAVQEETRGSIRRSIQFFSQDGLAIHKVYLTEDSIEEAYNTLVSKYKSDNQKPIQAVIEVIDEIKPHKNIKDIDIMGFHRAWLSMTHTHDFFNILKEYNLNRIQALELAPKKFFAEEINKKNIVKMLEEVSKQQVPIMVFVGNRGIIQIHTGKINNLLWHKQWYNIMDPDFNMHLDMENIGSVWLVRKPTSYGVITSVEVFDCKGKTIVQFFGKRKSIQGQSEEWIEITNNLN